MGTIVFVHGTGVRLREYTMSLEAARECAFIAEIQQKFVSCAWGESLGVQFKGESLPDYTDEQSEEEVAEFLYWSWLFEDPLYELEQMAISTKEPSSINGIPWAQPDWLKLFESIEAYMPSEEVEMLLRKNSLLKYWDEAWQRTFRRSSIAKEAFEASANELPAVSHALARALTAQLHVVATEFGVPGPCAALRDAIVERLLVDWGQKVLGVSHILSRIMKRLVTKAVRSRRQRLSEMSSLPIGDILLYQSRGDDIRNYIRQKIVNVEPPVTVIAHSLGGIACVDLLAMKNPPTISNLVTIGSQAPFFYEIGALASMQRPQQPIGFPPWLNIFDKNDFLSYVASRLWPSVEDVEVSSGQPFPDSHSAYFTNPETWRVIKGFIER